MGYLIVTIIAIILGQIVAHLNKKMPPVVAEEITYKEYYSTLFKDFKFDCKWSLILILISNLLIYFLGVNITSFVYIFISAILMVVFSIDFRFQLIPDESHIAIILLSLINIIFTPVSFLNSILGALTGGGIFLAIAVAAYFIYKKEGMGFGDVKLMAALGLLFGVEKILVVTLVSFFIGAIIGIIVILFGKKDASSYIAFGPFIVIASLLLMVIDPQIIIDLYIGLCSSISNVINEIVWFFIK